MTGHVQSLSVEGFRSIRDLTVEFDAVNVITGPNGCGKSNLFNAFKLVKASVQGRLSEEIAGAGGLESIMWAGRRPDGPVRMRLAVQADPFEYTVELGYRPINEAPLFPKDPQIKSETVKLGGRMMVKRKSSVAEVRSVDGPWDTVYDLIDSESIFGQAADAAKYPYLYSLRDLVHRWTFYHDFRTDPDSPIRRPALPTFSRRLAEDGSNLGPSLYTIAGRGERDKLLDILKDAFPGSSFTFGDTTPTMSVDGIFRSMASNEFSDGTLRFLCLAAACFSTHPSPLIAFNEPETSLNPSALEPLADLLANAALGSQLWITTHSESLTEALTRRVGCTPIRLAKLDGETMSGDRAKRLQDRRDQD